MKAIIAVDRDVELISGGQVHKGRIYAGDKVRIVEERLGMVLVEHAQGLVWIHESVLSNHYHANKLS
jgi:hypothetical protein